MGDRVIVVAGQAGAIGALRAGENKMQSVGAAFEILERETVCGVRVGKIDARENRPAAGRFAQGARDGGARAGVERRDRRPS